MTATATPRAAPAAVEAVTFENLSDALREVAEARSAAVRGFLSGEQRLRDALRRAASIAVALADDLAE